MIARVLIMIALPIVVWIGGGAVMQQCSGRSTAAGSGLGMKLGYDTDEVAAFWKSIRDSSPQSASRPLEAERDFLELDLIFPFFYGAALATSLLIGLVSLGRPFSPAWVLAPVALAVLADWAENLVQLRQLARYVVDEKSLQPNWIQIASAATVVKLIFTLGSLLLIAALAVAMMIRAR